MKEQYLILAELRRIDEKAFRLHNEIEKIPVEIQKIEKTIQTHKEQFLKQKSTVDELEKNIRKTEQDLREKDDFLKKAESKMMEVKTNEEYRAALKENETHKKEKAGIEEKLLGFMNILEGEKTKLTPAETAFKEIEGKLLGEKKEYEVERGKLLKHFEEQSEKRKTRSSGLTGEFQSAYEKARSKIKTSAIEIVDAGQCQGCNMKVRSQLYNEVLSLRTLHKCPSCGRILIPHSIDAEVASA